jgi:hypothetical protein
MGEGSPMDPVSVAFCNGEHRSSPQLLQQKEVGMKKLRSLSLAYSLPPFPLLYI